jgi:DNA adenine methylase
LFRSRTGASSFGASPFLFLYPYLLGLHYLGGKYRTAKTIGSFLNKIIEKTDAKLFLEPFCGACWITQQITGSVQRIAADVHPDLMLMWQSLQNGWTPPPTVTEEDYRFYRQQPPSATRGFVGFGASFGGKWFGGYGRDPRSPRNYSLNAHNSLLRKIQRLHDVRFISCSFDQIPVESVQNAVIYCDPPYINTTGYKGVQFDPEGFWQWVRQASEKNHVFVSEYQAPKDFECVLELPTKTDLNGASGEKLNRIERLFHIID